MSGVWLATNQKVGSSNLSGRTMKSNTYNLARSHFRRFDSYRDSYRPENLIYFLCGVLLRVERQVRVDILRGTHRGMP